MECNIMGCDKKVIKKPCYKTKYKNIVIVKLKDRCYSITHYQTGVSISTKRYVSVDGALLDLDNVINKARENLKNNNITFKQFAKQNNLKQINF